MFEWYDIREKRPEDHYWVLIAHKDFMTPMKAKYHSDAGGGFSYFAQDKNGNTYEGFCYIFDNKVNYWTDLPELPEDYMEDHKFDDL